jgi:hypothetical protein
MARASCSVFGGGKAGGLVLIVARLRPAYGAASPLRGLPLRAGRRFGDGLHQKKYIDPIRQLQATKLV